MNGESALTVLRQLLKLPHDPHPWDDLWLDVAVKHPTRDEWWDERNLLPLLKNIDIPVYLGCDWQNAPLHLPSTFTAWNALSGSRCVRMGMLGECGLTWPWESLHGEALAWFDHWLKGRDTGIVEGPAIGYFLLGADDWHTADSWPPPGSHREFALRADGALAEEEGGPDSRVYLVLGAGLNRAKPSPIDPPSMLTWTSEALSAAVDVVGDIELQLVASATAIDTAWIAILQDVAPDGTVSDVTAGWLRASMREVDESASRPGRAGVAVPHRPGGAHRQGRRLSNPVGTQCSSLPCGPSHPGDANQRRPGSGHKGHHELQTCQRRHEQPQQDSLVVTPLAASPPLVFVCTLLR
jgi:uncharacterized protein